MFIFNKVRCFRPNLISMRLNVQTPPVVFVKLKETMPTGCHKKKFLNIGPRTLARKSNFLGTPCICMLSSAFCTCSRMACLDSGDQRKARPSTALFIKSK